MPCTVLLLVDVQRGVSQLFPTSTEWWKHLASVIQGARDAGVYIFYTSFVLNPNDPATSLNTAFIDGESAWLLFCDFKLQTAIHPEVRPASVDSGFRHYGLNPLEYDRLGDMLDFVGAEHLVVAGLGLRRVILETVRAATNMQLEVSVLRDCCLDEKPEWDDLALGLLMPREVSVVTSWEWFVELAQENQQEERIQQDWQFQQDIIDVQQQDQQEIQHQQQQQEEQLPLQEQQGLKFEQDEEEQLISGVRPMDMLLESFNPDECFK